MADAPADRVAVELRRRHCSVPQLFRADTSGRQASRGVAGPAKRNKKRYVGNRVRPGVAEETADHRVPFPYGLRAQTIEQAKDAEDAAQLIESGR
jgi:hypothetical protein